MSSDTNPTITNPTVLISPWLTVGDAAQHAKCGRKSIYNGVASGKLQAARLGGRRELRFLAEWVDGWLIETSRAIPVVAGRPVGSV
jgi:excisionase family DNA binding protein